MDISCDELFANAGSLDILVNNAGIWPTAYVNEMTTAAFNKTMDINLIAPFILCRNFVNQCQAEGKKGKIVNMTSQAAFHGSTSGHAHYAASKAGLVMFDEWKKGYFLWNESGSIVRVNKRAPLKRF